MSDQLTLDTGDQPTRSTWRALDPETGELSEPWRDSPAGCLRCNMHTTERRLFPEVILLGSKRWGGIMLCPDHGEQERVTILADRAADEARKRVYDAQRRENVRK